MTALWTITLGLALVSNPSGRWVGQDGHDFTSMLKGTRPSGYQDMHFVLTGLPPEREITKIVMTGDGGGLWNYPHKPGSAAIALARPQRSRTASLYVEPYTYEKGRNFLFKLFYDDGSKAEVLIRGGKANPNLRMPEAAMVAKWIGQERRDEIGPGLGVGPDGLQDVRISLSKLDPEVEVKWIDIEGPDRQLWQAGPNRKGYPSAEFVRDPKDRTKGDLYFQPEVSFAGEKIRLSVAYSNDRGDSAVVAPEHFEPHLEMPKLTAPTLVPNTIKARWLGQDGSNGGEPADVHIALSDLPKSPGLTHAVLTDGIQGSWVHRGNDQVPLHVDPYSRELTVKPGKDRSEADLYFTPTRDESNTTLTLRLVLADGSMTAVSIAGEPCDLMRRVPAVAATSTRAKPGDELNDLAKRFGSITLAPGTYRLTKPLILEQPVRLLGEPGSVLLFDQGDEEQPWSTAIKIHASGTTLKGFQVRFARPVRWRRDVSFGAAIIGTTDNLDQGHGKTKVGLEFSQLDIESPPVPHPERWEEAPRLMRLINASLIRIANNRIKGGVIEFFGGPLECVENEFCGTAPGTFSHGFITGHFVHDLTIRGNRARPVAPSGKVWRFLTLTESGEKIRVDDNIIVEVGARDNDTIPWANAPEIVLTESYHLNFEGKIAALSSDGRIVRVPKTQAGPPHAGDFVSILAGPHAGQWRRIAQTLSPTEYLLASPLPAGSELVSIANGFAGFRFSGNTIDSRGGRRASNLVFAGNHYGTIVRNNRLLGGESFRLLACPTESPMSWGWSHTPYLSGVFEENIIEDSPHGGFFAVEHSEYIRSNSGRTYMTLTLRNNTVRWTERFVKDHVRTQKRVPPPGIKIGSTLSLDPGELLVYSIGDHFQAPAGTRPSEAMRVDAAIINGSKIVRKAIVLPVSPLPPEITRTRSR